MYGGVGSINRGFRKRAGGHHAEVALLRLCFFGAWGGRRARGRHTSAGVEHVDAGAHAGARLAGRRAHAAAAAGVEVGVVALEGARVRDVVAGAGVGVVDDAAAPGGRARGERGTLRQGWAARGGWRRS